MRYIRNISDDQNKSGDTDNIFRFNLLQDEDIFNFGDYPISVNIANSSGYILSMVPEKEFGNSVVKLDFNDQSLKSLTPDNYLLEVEVKFPDGTTATFPTKGGMQFSVNSNLKNTAGQLVPTVTFDEVLNAVDKKVNNYLATVAKGDKGDTGVIDTSKDYTFTGTNTFNKKIIALAGVQGNADTATKLQTARAIGGVSFDGSDDINLPGVNTAGNQDTTGNAASADALKGKELTIDNINVVTSDMLKYAGIWGVNTSVIKGMPNIAFAVMEVVPYPNNRASGVIKLSSTFDFVDGVKVGFQSYIGYVISSTISTWDKLPDDNNLVHNTGTETIAGDKTFTGTNTFTQPVIGSLKTREAIFTDFADVAKNMFKYTGNWQLTGSSPIKNSPYGSTQRSAYVTVNSSGWNDAGLITFTDTSWEQKRYYIAIVAGGDFTNWIRLSDDSKVVHNTGTETVAGDKTFTGNNTFTGQTSFWFKQIQWTSGIMQGTWYLQRMGNFVFARFEKSQNTGTGDTSLALPVGYRPINNWILDAERGQSGINGNGTVFIGTAYTDNTSMTYIYPTNDAWPTA